MSSSARSIFGSFQANDADWTPAKESVTASSNLRLRGVRWHPSDNQFIERGNDRRQPSPGFTSRLKRPSHKYFRSKLDTSFGVE